MHYLYKCRVIDQNGDSFEGKQGCIMNSNGTVSYDYKQGITKYSNGLLLKGSSINNLWNGKVNSKWKNGHIQITENLNSKRHSPAIIYDFEGEVIMDYFSNGKIIFLL